MEISLEKVCQMDKSALLATAQEFGLEVDDGMQKSQLLAEVVKCLTAKELAERIGVDERVSSPSVPLESNESVDDFRRDLEIEERRMRMDLERREREERLAMEMRESEGRLALEREKLELERLRIERSSPPSAAHTGLDLRQFRDAPQFREEEVDQYFPAFERCASELQWPEERWALALGSRLTGRALEVYHTLPASEARDYKVLKREILKRYSLTPEAYRQKFRKACREENETYRDFAYKLKREFSRWCESEGVDSFEGLQELLILEQFKNSASERLRTHLTEREVRNVDRAACMADDFQLVHGDERDEKSHWKTGKNTKQRYWGKKDSQQTETGKSKESEKKQTVGGYFKCYNCGKTGHIARNCRAKKVAFVQRQEIMLMKEEIPIGNLSHSKRKSQDELSENADNDERGTGSETLDESFLPFVSKGTLRVGMVERPVTVFRDTGSSITIVRQDLLGDLREISTGNLVVLSGIFGEARSAPLCTVELETREFSGEATVAVCDELPIPRVDVLIGNDVGGRRVNALPVVSEKPTSQESEKGTDLYPCCAITRSQDRRRSRTDDIPDVCLGDTFLSGLLGDDSNEERHQEGLQEVRLSEKGLETSDLADEQRKDPTLAPLFEEVGLNDPGKAQGSYYLKRGLLMRKSRPQKASPVDEWKEEQQIVLPQSRRQFVLKLAHGDPMSGHLGVGKTYQRLKKSFYWPGLLADVKRICRNCPVCQVAGKKGQDPPRAALRPIPVVEEPFTRVIVDCVGPLPRSKSGHEYLLTIMCATTRFVEAVPLRRIHAKAVSEQIVKFFTTFGLPREVQTDQGTNFTSRIFRSVLGKLGIRHVVSSPYHPESQGALERFHRTLKEMLRCYCDGRTRDWPEGVPFVLFAIRSSVQESLGFTPFELVFGHEVRGPLEVVKDNWSQRKTKTDLLTYVTQFKERLEDAVDCAKKHLGESKERMKAWYDRRARDRQFQVGDKVLVMTPLEGNALRARYRGPHTVGEKRGEVTYVINTPDGRKKRRLCHINMLKKFHENEARERVACVTTKPEMSVKRGNEIGAKEENEGDCESERELHDSQREGENENEILPSCGMKNSNSLEQIEESLTHLSPERARELADMCREFEVLFRDVPSRTSVTEHDIQLSESVAPIRQHPYRMSGERLKALEAEVSYLLENGMIQPGSGAWCSPCLMVKKADGGWRMCTDYRRVNAVTKGDSYPLPRIEDCIDAVGNSKFVTKIDLLKGYYAVPLTKRAREISAFVTPRGLYQYTVMPFGLKNSPATFQRLMNQVTSGLPNCRVYIDDCVVYSQSWEEHMAHLRQLLVRLRDANLTINLSKSSFATASVVYLGHEIGNGRVSPRHSKVEALAKMFPPQNKKGIRRFLGMVGYYRKFCENFAEVALPLTDMLGEKKRFQWTERCQEAFESLKALLMCEPILLAPDPNRPFLLMTDASDNCMGSVLMQADDLDVRHPVAYFSQKFLSYQRRYSTVEKEALSLVTSLQHFEVYCKHSLHPVTVFTDHNPLTFLKTVKGKNQRLLRWSLILQEFDLIVKHVPGKQNVIADCLSRD